MRTIAVNFCLMAAAVALAACGGETENPWATGAVKFHLELPDGQNVERIDLRLVCQAAGVDITSSVNVRNRNVAAVFGGLAPGMCTVTMTTKTDKGIECAGTQAFTVVANQTVDVNVVLACQGINTGGAGTARVRAVFETRDCSADRIKLIEAVPGDLLLGESATVRVETHPNTAVGTPKLKFSLRNEANHTAQGMFTDAGTCPAGAVACRSFTCTGLGGSTSTDPLTGLPSAGVFISVEYEDDHCLDTEEIWIACLQSGVCGDGKKDGVEECDDGNTTVGDGCSATCKVERCGDGVKNGAEECDGTDGVTVGKMCNNTTCTLEDVVTAPVCGDGAVNQASEQCDGTAGLQPNQTCGNDCKIVPVCGNGIVEGSEQCDAPNDPACVSCTTQGGPGPVCGDGVKNGAEECDGTAGLEAGQVCGNDCKIVPTCGNGIVEGSEQCDAPGDATCVRCQRQQQGNACLSCIEALDEIGPFYKDQCKGEALCSAALSCVLENKSCWGDIAAAACYCGDSQADIDACEQPTFVPKGRCATAFKAGAGAGATNAEVLQRYFDPAFPVGNATIVADGAFTSGCKAACF